MNMKLPLSVIILIVWALFSVSYITYMTAMETKDSNFKEIGAVKYHEAELKAWKAGDCYVFGVDIEHEHSHAPVFFSNCQKR